MYSIYYIIVINTKYIWFLYIRVLITIISYTKYNVFLLYEYNYIGFIY